MDHAVAQTQTRDRSGPRAGEPAECLSAALPLIPVKHVRYAKAKRAFDIVASLIGLAVGLPLFVLVAVLVRATSRGPVLFKQTRVGMGGRLFTCYKFRSMYVDAEARRAEIEHLNEMSGPVFKARHDPRITPVGRWIRKFSLDELPQLISVLRGEMSVVGPRPPIPQEVAAYDQGQLGRLAVKPGLTCIWQISGRSDIDFDQWVEMDLEYVASMSLLLDLEIVLKTVPAVVSARGAR